MKDSRSPKLTLVKSEDSHNTDWILTPDQSEWGRHWTEEKQRQLDYVMDNDYRKEKRCIINHIIKGGRNET